MKKLDVSRKGLGNVARVLGAAWGSRTRGEVRKSSKFLAAASVQARRHKRLRHALYSAQPQLYSILQALAGTALPFAMARDRSKSLSDYTRDIPYEGTLGAQEQSLNVRERLIIHAGFHWQVSRPVVSINRTLICVQSQMVRCPKNTLSAGCVYLNHAKESRKHLNKCPLS